MSAMAFSQTPVGSLQRSPGSLAMRPLSAIRECEGKGEEKGKKGKGREGKRERVEILTPVITE